MNKLLIIVLASSLLVGCTGWVNDDGSPMTVNDLNTVLSGTAAATQQMSRDSIAIMNQSNRYQPVEVQQIRQPDGTTWVYCRGVTDTLYVCRTY